VKKITINSFLAIISLFGVACANATTNIVVQAPSCLHNLESSDSQDLLLHSDGAGSAYLYVEQQHGAQMNIFDVTDLEHIKLAASIQTGSRGAYDFVAPINDRYELISYRDGSGTALLDLHKAKAPRTTVVEGISAAPTKLLGAAGYLTSSREIKVTTLAPQNIEVVEITDKPHTVATVANVTRQVTRSETGTTFLLNDEGISIIRRPDAEQQYVLDQHQP